MRNLRFRYSVAVVVATLFSSALAVSTAASPESAVGDDPFQRAAAEGEPVEIVEARTATETLFANPSGTYTREIASAPVRVETARGWAPIDLDLVKTAEGLRPKAAPGNIALSDGGDGPLLAHTVEGVATAMTWPESLPEPTIDGPTATYAEVFEGVDLRMTVTDAGVSQVLVVADRKAAANPALRDIRLDTQVEGGTLREANGGFEILDPTGRIVGIAPEPTMWDSSGTVLNQDAEPLGDASDEAIDQRVSGPADGDSISPIDLDLAADELRLKPTGSALTGAKVKYPIYIDPAAGRSAFAWSMVFKQHPNLATYKWTTGDGQGVGYQNYNGVSTKRLFFQYNMSFLPDVQIITATFKARMNWSASCTERPIRLYRTGAVSSKDTWNDQPTWGTYVGSKSYSAGWSGCNPSGKDVVWDIKKVVQDAADEKRTSLGLGMRTQDETDPLTWRRFRHTTSITVEYNRKPNKPSPRSINFLSCPEDTVIRFGRMTSPPVIRAGLSDPDGDNVRIRVKWWNGYTVSSAATEIYGPYIASGATAALNYPVAPGAGGTIPSGAYSFNARAQDAAPAAGMSGEVSDTSDECTFTVDATAAPTPIVKGVPGQWIMGTTYNIEFWPGGTAADTVGYRYSIDSDVPPTTAMLSASGTNRTYVKPMSFSTPGVKTIRLWAYDAVGNRSEYPAIVPIEVVDPAATTRSSYDFDEPSGTTANDRTGQFPLALGDAVRSQRGTFVDMFPEAPEYDGMIRLDPTMSAAPGVDGPVIDPGRSFTVAALLDPNLDTSAGAQTAVRFGGTGSNVFELGVVPDGSDGANYVFKVWDAATNAWVSATLAGDDGLPGTRLVVGVYDSLTHKLRLRAAVPGEDTWAEATSSGSATPVSSLVAPRLELGSDSSGGSRWNGYLDHLVVAQGAFGVDDEKTLANQVFRTTECYAQEGGC